VLGRSETRFDIEKVKAILEFPIPRIIINVWAFLGLIGYYCSYAKEYACIAMPLLN
jgi:hypothetical protein